MKINQDGNNIAFLKGILDIPNDNKEIAGHFLIEIHFTEEFPYKFPICFETGGEIPSELDWHKYADERCCITVLPDEILKCKKGITISLFIDEHVIPYFANQLYKKQTGKYKSEYPHGIQGTAQFYETLLMTTNKQLWLQYFKNTFRNLKISCRRNDTCFCGSGSRYKLCHFQVFNTLYQIGEKQVLYDFKQIIQ